MTTEEFKKRMVGVKNLMDFQNEFYHLDQKTFRMIPDCELVYWNGANYTSNPAAISYDRLGNCNNCFVKCEDGFVEYPF